MEQRYEIKPIGFIKTDYPEKFGIPRQSGLVNGLPAQIRFTPDFRSPDAFRDLDGYSHIWLLWYFSENDGEEPRTTVRPPRLGGNRRVGVFASRSPYHPNRIGLSLVRLLGIDLNAPGGPVLTVDGADLLDGTPILDIKPYLPKFESIPDAKGGYAQGIADHALRVRIPETLMEKIPEEKRLPLKQLLSQDPKPGYHDDPDRIYGLSFAGMNVRFTTDGEELTVTAVETEKE